jgi:hypothetical protein
LIHRGLRPWAGRSRETLSRTITWKCMFTWSALPKCWIHGTDPGCAFCHSMR